MSQPIQAPIARCQVCVQPLAGNSLQSKLPQGRRARAQRPQAVGSGSAGPTPCEHDAAAQRDSSGEMLRRWRRSRRKRGEGECGRGTATGREKKNCGVEQNLESR